MVIKSRPYKRKNAPRRRRKPVRYAGKRIPKSIPSQTHVYKRYGDQLQLSNFNNTPPGLTGAINGWQVGPATPDIFPGTSRFGVSASFNLAQVLNHQEFTNLYDRYKILGVKLKFLYQSATAQDQTSLGATSISNNAVLPIMDHTFDIDDDNVPLFQTTVTQHAYAKTNILQANQPLKKYCKPRTKSFTVSGTGAPGSNAFVVNEKTVWLDCTFDAVPHYGLKFWFSSWPYDPSTTAQPHQGCLTIQPIYYLAFKDSQ